MADVFFSYAHEDSDIVRRLNYLFELEDWSCWLDKPRIRLGEDFRPAVTQAITEAKVVLVLWSPVSRRSPWVQWETEYARQNGKLVELAVQGDSRIPSSPGGPLEISTYPHIPPIRDEVLRWVAEHSKLIRRSDGWNSQLIVSNWNQLPPRKPLIGWEWVNPGNEPRSIIWVEPGKEPRRIIRRERWDQEDSVTYGTTIGNAWVFGEEESTVAIGHIFITQKSHTVQLPRAPRPKNGDSFTIPFNVNVRVTELLSRSPEDEMSSHYPDWGVDLGAPSGKE